MKKEKIKLKRVHVQVKKSEIHRYGVFATKYFKINEVIEECPILLLNDLDYSPTLNNYVFRWESPKEYALALGYGSLYNHSAKPNVSCSYDLKNELLIFSAERPIFQGEELFICYSDDWFKDRNIEIRNPKNNKYRNYRILNLIFWILLLLGLLTFLTITNR